MPSYSPVFSAQFVVHAAGTPLVPFIVPAGFTAVIRDMTAFTGVGGAIIELLIADGVDAPALRVASIGVDGVTAYGQWTGRVVVPENGVISNTTVTVGDDVDVYVGGYLLRNVAA